ncbi:hypothetical protein OHS33_38800 (plasmid) [Streptomyces sp. NBC_00536]|uniref:hypothetical protein n=1 Tax=Streptomyces sp. NBC_00536 TaxID=2975769 RepID=UPI002E81BBF6|nr:hypothetical protein [Streptomyces sp. NBC_00536]WUC84453.1 hypothetical protein OHS33_38800 [Streptomyces sp. NBC_00536]
MPLLIVGLALGTVSGVGTLLVTEDGALAAVVAVVVITLAWLRVWTIIVPDTD